MSESEFAVRSVGEDATFSGSGERVGGRSSEDRSRSSNRSRSERSEEPVAVVQAAPEQEQKPFLLALAERVAELLSALWDRLNSL